jgi:hypothetical protein
MNQGLDFTNKEFLFTFVIPFSPEKCYTSQNYFSKAGFQMICHHHMRFIILENVSPTYRMVTHHLKTNF